MTEEREKIVEGLLHLLHKNKQQVTTIMHEVKQIKEYSGVL